MTIQIEKNYYNFELEIFATVRTVKHFHIYKIYFIVIMDCHAFVYAINKENLN